MSLFLILLQIERDYVAYSFHFTIVNAFSILKNPPPQPFFGFPCMVSAFPCVLQHRFRLLVWHTLPGLGLMVSLLPFQLYTYNIDTINDR